MSVKKMRITTLLGRGTGTYRPALSGSRGPYGQTTQTIHEQYECEFKLEDLLESKSRIWKELQ